MADEQIDEVKGQGGEAEVTEPTLQELKAEAEAIARQGEKGLWGTRVDAQNTRYCMWDGQSADGRKHASANDEVPVEPFEGACDGRHRIADMLINEDVMLVVLASLRARIRIKGVEATDAAYAGNMELLLRWLIRNQLGWTYLRELIKLANYVIADSPALGLMGVSWQRKTSLEMRTLTVEELMTLYIELSLQNVPEDINQAEYEEQVRAAAEDFTAALADAAWDPDELANLLIVFFPHLRLTRARKVIRGLRERGSAEFPAPYVKYNGIQLKAKRSYEDWFVPMNTTEFQEARIYFEPEWLPKTSIIERQISEGWTDKFVEGVIGTKDPTGKRVGGKEGSGAFKAWVCDADGAMVEATQYDYNGLYQIINAFFIATNEDGVPGIYFITFHPDVDVAATTRKLLGYKTGKYPGHVFQREPLTNRLVDSRGVAELAASNQGMTKLFFDSGGDNAQITAVPPIITRGRKTQGRLYIAPMVELQARRDGDYKWMQPPAYPASTINMAKELRQQTNEYHGRPGEGVDPATVTMHRQFKVAWWLANLTEVHVQMLQLCQQFMPDEIVQRITNSEGVPVMKGRADIQGQFDLQMEYDAQDMDPEYLAALGKTIRDVLMAMDTQNTIQASPIAAAILWRLAPDLAEVSLRSVDRANVTELEDEIKNYQLIRAGMEPPMVTDGSQNYELRLNLYRQMEQANPAVYGDMSQDKLAILQARIQHLTVMAQQYGENVAIGRQGARAALEAPPSVVTGQ